MVDGHRKFVVAVVQLNGKVSGLVEGALCTAGERVRKKMRTVKLRPVEIAQAMRGKKSRRV